MEREYEGGGVSGVRGPFAFVLCVVECVVVREVVLMTGICV